MKLTNHMRDTFVKAAMLDVPEIDYKETIRTLAVKIAADKLPPKIKALWKDNELRGYIKLETKYFSGVGYIWLPAATDGVVFDEKEKAEINALQTKADEQRDQRRALAEKLRGVAYGCTTRKALLEALPEFEKYMPLEVAVTSNLPAIANVVADFTKAGWPKDKKAEPKEAEAA